MTSPVMKRLVDWRPRLLDYVTSCSRQQFKPGRHDCALFWAGAIEAMTGIDPAKPWRGNYHSLKAGMAQIKAAGFEDHIAGVASLLLEIPPAYAQVGDTAVVATDGPMPAAIGIVQGEMIYVLKPDGLGMVPLTSAIRAFRL